LSAEIADLSEEQAIISTQVNEMCGNFIGRRGTETYFRIDCRESMCSHFSMRWESQNRNRVAPERMVVSAMLEVLYPLSEALTSAH
jgi:hypothetical protein